MTFVPKSFSALTALPALDLNHMDANDDHVREEANYVPIVTAQCTPQRSVPSGYFKIMIDTTRPTQTAIVNTGSGSEADIDISSYAEALHDISIWVYVSGDEAGGSIVFGPFAFFKSPDLEKLSWKVNRVDDYNSTGKYLYNITIIGHRETKSW